MEITILTSDEQIITLNVNPNITVEDLKTLLEVKKTVTLLFDGKEMVKNSRRLRKYGVSDGDLVVMNSVSPSRNEMIENSMRLNNNQDDGDSEVMNIRASSNELLGFKSDGSPKNPSAFRQHILKDHDMLARIWMYDPELCEIIVSDGEIKYINERLKWFLRIRHCQRAILKRQLQNKEWGLLHADQPDHCIIKGWDDKLKDILYYVKPEIRPRVHVKINGKKVQNVLVDTGATVCTITEACAKACGLGEIIGESKNEPLTAMDGKVITTVGLINIATVKCIIDPVHFLPGKSSDQD